MLVLARRLFQEVSITVPPSNEPTEIRVVLLELRKETIRLGFDAPREIRIVRDDAKNKENRNDH